jgi:hypothetical protein
MKLKYNGAIANDDLLFWFGFINYKSLKFSHNSFVL